MTATSGDMLITSTSLPSRSLIECTVCDRSIQSSKSVTGNLELSSLIPYPACISPAPILSFTFYTFHKYIERVGIYNYCLSFKNVNICLLASVAPFPMITVWPISFKYFIIFSCSGETFPPFVRLSSIHNEYFGQCKSGIPGVCPSAFNLLATLMARFPPFGIENKRSVGNFCRHQFTRHTCSSCSVGILVFKPHTPTHNNFQWDKYNNFYIYLQHLYYI